MKKRLFFILLFFILLTTTFYGINNNYVFAEQYYYTYDVEHLFFHCLIAYPEIAFAPNNPIKKSYLNDCITPLEFCRVLDSLYKNNYVLVSICDCFYVENNIAYKQKIKVPCGKKAIILSFDDVNYDSKKIGYGMVDKIILDNKGDIATQTKLKDKIDVSYNREFLPILENFIKSHPDFSYNGARGTINLTGYDGILGYRTSHTNTSEQKDLEITIAKNVVTKLKSLGWTFACHSYGHYHMKKISDEKFKQEITNWKNEVKPLIGKTNIYVYPYGEWEVFKNGDYSQKHKMLLDNGFNLFCGVGMKTFYSYLPNNSGKKVLFMDRKVVDGTTLRSNNQYLKPFFSPTEIIDSLRPL